MSVQRLFPPGGDSDVEVDPLTAVAAEDRPRPPDRPWVLTNMIASADGAIAVGGLSGPLGGPADHAVFMALRSVADAIVVGAETVRAERYRAPGAGSDAARRARADRRQAERPLLVVVTSSLSLPTDLPLFDDPGYRPLIVTTTRAPRDRRAALAPVADVIDGGDDRVDLAALLSELDRRGIQIVLCEGGPSLNAQFIADGLVDEWNLTVSNLLAAGSAKRAAQGPQLVGPPAAMALSRVWQADDQLFCRWVRPAAG